MNGAIRKSFSRGGFRTRHALLAVVNIAAGAQEVQKRLAAVARGLEEPDEALLADCLDEYERVFRLAEPA